MGQLDLQHVVDVLKHCGLVRGSFGITKGLWTGEIQVDSRKITAGDIFIAYKGVSADGHAFLENAVRAGAGCLILEDEKRVASISGCPYILVSDAREAWAHLAAHRHGNPERRLTFIGITGTNGKTSSVWMIRQLLEALGHRCMSLGTLGMQIGTETGEATHTTPDPDVLFAHLAHACASGVTHVAMEVSSHALEQRKLGPIKFAAAGFTSFSQDHLDYHETMADYLAAKKRLFCEYLVGSDALVVLHEGIVHHLRDILPCSSRLTVYGQGDYVGEGLAHLAVTYSRFWPLAVGGRASSVRVQVGSAAPRELNVPFFGDVFLANFLGALTIVALLTGEDIPAELCERLAPVPGRMEPVQATARQPGVFVDYAHTPDALEKVLRIARGFLKGELWVVFGCGGDRDRKKRPLMAAAAAAGANHVVITSDNPRTENPHAIIADIVAGLADKDAAVVIEQREAAIAYAMEHAKAEDLIVIAGKGHEDYQIIGKVKTPFDDRKVARKVLERFW